MFTVSYSVNLLEGNTSQRVTLSAVSAQSTQFLVPGAAANPDLPPPTPGQYVLITGDVAFWARQGANPTAVVDVDQYFPANNSYRVSVANGNRIAAVAAGAGNLYITPLA